MAYTAPYCDKSGIHIPNYDERLEELIAGYKRIFGDDVYLGEDTMDYQMLSLFAKSMDDMSSVILDTYNARNPYYASGTALDIALPYAGITRRVATFGTAVLQLTGTPSTTVSAGMQAKDENGHVWNIDGEFSFDANGDATVNATCAEAGAIVANVGQIKEINTPNGNWYTVTNPAAAVPGKNTETDAEARLRFKKSYAMTGISTLDGIMASLINIPGVDFARVYENDTGSTDARGIPAHSICAVVDGGEANDIAEAIKKKKTPGVMTYGSSSGTYTDAYGVENTINFLRPSHPSVSVTVTITNLGAYNATTMNAKVKQAIADYINKLDIGENFVVSSLYGVIFDCLGNSSPIISINSISASSGSQTNITGVVAAAFNDRFSCSVSDITITAQS